MRAVTDVLDEQHRHIADLFEQVSDPDADRPAVMHAILRDLAAHVAAERAAVAPVVKSKGLGGDELADQLTEDYERIEKMMVSIERRKFNSPEMPGRVTELKDLVEAHIERCRTKLAPAIAEGLSSDEQQELAEKVENADEVVVSHPHPHLLSTGPIGSKLLGFVSRFDRFRDRAHPTKPNSHEEADPSMGGAT